MSTTADEKSTDLSVLTPEIVRITQELFPGEVSIGVVDDPENPQIRLNVVKARATGPVEEVGQLAKAGHKKLAELVRRCSKNSDSDGRSLAVGCARAWFKNPESSYKGQQIDHADRPLIGHPKILAESMGDEFADKFAGVLWALLHKKDRRYRTELFIRYSIPREEITKGVLSAQLDLVAGALSKIEEPLTFLLNIGKA
jgi:hypothetical protein